MYKENWSPVHGYYSNSLASMLAELFISSLSDPECIFDAIIRDPYYLSQYFHNGTVDNLTIPMRQKIAHSIGLYEKPILPIR